VGKCPDKPQAPKYALIERERRWLVKPSRPSLVGRPFVLIQDRYLVGTRLRLRKLIPSDGAGATYKLTKKYHSEDSLARPITTQYLDESEFSVFSTLDGALLTKRRYKVDGYSIDCFEGPLAGLELAELEAPDEASLNKLSLPDWIGTEISRDVQFEGNTLAQLNSLEAINWPSS